MKPCFESCCAGRRRSPYRSYWSLRQQAFSASLAGIAVLIAGRSR